MKHILYVHDDQVDPKPRQDFLELAGYKVTAMQDARRCVSLLEGEQPDLIVSDALVHGMTGFQLCYEVRQRYRAEQVPFLLCSSIYKGSTYVEEAECVGVQEFMFHPLDLKKFIQNVQELLGDAKHHENQAA